MNPPTTYRFTVESIVGDDPHIFYRPSRMNLAAQKRWLKKAQPHYTLLECIPSPEHAILDAVKKAGGAPWAALQAKCRWEQMTLLAVIAAYGDTRKWRSVTDQYAS